MALLRLFRERERYDKLIKTVNFETLDQKTRVILEDYGAFYREFEDTPRIEHDAFWLWFKSFRHPKFTEEAKSTYETLLRQAAKAADPGVEAGLAARLVAANAAHRLASLLEDYSEGAEIDLGVKLREVLDKYEMDTDRKVKTPEVIDAIDDWLQDDIAERGFKFRLDDLNHSIRPLQPGDFIIVAARPDQGKTTFLASELTYMAPQIDDLFPDEGRNIAWFNNEGPGRRIVQRCYQAALGALPSQMRELSQKGILRKRYARVMGGPQRLRVYDVHDFWNHEVEDVIRDTRPAIVVLDMIDNIRFGGDANNNGQRTDQLLEAMYQWGRMMAVKHDCVVIATSQVSADGENLRYPLLGMLKDSRTGKQGAADLILTIGAQSDRPNSRWLGTTKNKLHKEGGPKSPNLEVLFNGQRARYEELIIADEGSVTDSDVAGE